MLRSILSSGEYSDLTLKSYGEALRLHKAVACSQSRVIAAAMNGNFVESRTNELVVDDSFELENVKRMVDFLYRGQYTTIAPPDHDGTPQTTTSSGPGAIDQASSPGMFTKTGPQMGDDAGFQREAKRTVFYFSAHLGVYEIAHYYEIELLEIRQVTKLKNVLDNGKRTPQTFVDMAIEVLDRTDNEILLGYMVDATVIHLPSLAGAGVLGQIERHPTFLVKALNACGLRLLDCRREILALRNVSP